MAHSRRAGPRRAPDAGSPVTGKTSTEVKRKLRNKRAEIAKAGQAAVGNATRKTVKAWANDWLTIRQTKVRPKTWEGDSTSVRQWIVPAIGAKRLVDLAPRDVRAVHASQRNAGHKPASLLRTHWTLLRMLRDAVNEGYVVPGGVFESDAPSTGEHDREAMETIQAVAVLHHAADPSTGHGGPSPSTRGSGRARR